MRIPQLRFVLVPVVVLSAMLLASRAVADAEDDTFADGEARALVTG